MKSKTITECYEDYANALCVKVDELEPVEKQQAVLNAVLHGYSLDIRLRKDEQEDENEIHR